MGDRAHGRQHGASALRVVFLNQFFAPDEAATAQMLDDLVEAARAEGIECHVVCSDRSYAHPERRYPRREGRPGLAVRRVPATAFGRSGAVGRVLDYATYAAGAAVELLRGPAPDVVVGLSTPPLLGALAHVGARLRGARSVYWVMDVYPDVAFALGALQPESWAGRILRALSRRTLAGADCVVALGETMAERLAALGARRVETVHNWADSDAIRPKPPSESRLRERLGWQARFVVLYSGNLGLAHEFETLLGAADLLRDRADVLFAFLGHGPRFAEVEHAARARALPNVAFHPALPRDELGDSLAAGDLHVVTLRPAMAGLLVPSKIYGILAAARPTLYVGPPEGEVWSILRNGGCGTACPNGDAVATAAAILAYRDAPERRVREGRAARELLERSFTRTRQTARLVGLIQGAAGGR